MTDEQLALLIDPKRERHPDWWICICKECYGLWQHYGSGAAETASKAQANCNYANHLEGIREYYYTGPPLTTDRVAAFTYITPVLLACDWTVTVSQCGTWVQDQDGVTIVHESSCHAAATAALAWLKENAPERLRKALEGVGHG